MESARLTDTHWSWIYERGRDFTPTPPEFFTELSLHINNDLPRTCLDIGCGTGELTRELYARGYNCVGIDTSTSALTVAESLTAATGNGPHSQRLDIERDSAEHLPQQQFSLITCKLVYAFIMDKPTFLQTVRHMLVPGGTFAVITPHVDDVAPERRHIGVTDDELMLLSAQFTPLALYKFRRDGDPGGILTYFIGQAAK